MLQALTTTFNLLETSRSLGDAASAECSTAILLLTDGQITQGLGFDDPTEISDLVLALNADIQAQIFTFALGPEADSVSCCGVSKRLAYRVRRAQASARDGSSARKILIKHTFHLQSRYMQAATLLPALCRTTEQSVNTSAILLW